jgi:Ricin-type beta-trefoil lectin domain-like
MNLSHRSIVAVFLLGMTIAACDTSSPSEQGVAELTVGVSIDPGTVEQGTAEGSLSAQALILGTTYWISNMCNAKRLEVQRNIPAGAVLNVQIRTGDDTLGQRWKLAYAGPGYVTFEVQSNGQVLTIGGGIKTDGGIAVTSSKRTPTLLEQQWRVETAANGFSILTARHSGKILQVQGASSADGAQVEQGTNASKCHQRWKFTPVPVTPAPTALRLLYSPETGGLVKYDSRAETFARNSSIINQLPGNAIYLTTPGTYSLYGRPRDEAGVPYSCLTFAELPNGDPEDLNPTTDANGQKCVRWPYSKSVWKVFLAPLKTANPKITKRIAVGTELQDFFEYPVLLTDTVRWNQIITNIQHFLAAMKETDPTYIWVNDNEPYGRAPLTDYSKEFFKTVGSSFYPSIPQSEIRTRLTVLAKSWGTKIGQAIASNAPNISVLTLHGPYEGILQFDVAINDPTSITAPIMKAIAGSQLYPPTNELAAWMFSGMIEASPTANHIDGGELYELKLGKMQASATTRKGLYNNIADTSKVSLPFASNQAAWSKVQIGFGLSSWARFNTGGPLEYAQKVMEATRAASVNGIVWAYKEDTGTDGYSLTNPYNVALKNAGF